MGWGRLAPLLCELNLVGRPCGAGWVNKDINRGHRKESSTLSCVVSPGFLPFFLANSDDLVTSVGWTTGTDQGRS